MNTRNKVFTETDKVSYYIRYLQILNCLFYDLTVTDEAGEVIPVKMNDGQIEVLANFLVLDGELNINNRFNTSARKYVREKLGITLSSLSNHLTALRTKKIIYTNNIGLLDVREQFKVDINETTHWNLIIKPEYVSTNIEFNADQVDAFFDKSEEE